MKTLTEQAHERCMSWVKHSGLFYTDIAEQAGVAPGTVKRFKSGKGISARNLLKIEKTIPDNWRDPLPTDNAA